MVSYFLLLIHLASATDGYSLAAGANQDITEFSTCKTVTNNRSTSIFIPTKFTTEWTSFYTNLPSSVTAVTCASVCPTGFVEVPADATLSTPAFCVMQYEARNVSGAAVSQETGLAWTSQSADNAFIECASNYPAGYNGRMMLIPNSYWMAVARNAEQVASNWSSGTVGTGSMSRGYSASSANGDAFTNTSQATSAAASCLYNTAANTCAATGTSLYKRTLALSNGEIIWDFAGNLDEWVDWSSGDSVQTANPGTCAQSYTAFSSNCASWATNDYKPNNTSATGVGKWYGGTGTNDTIRGGNFASGINAGLFAIYGNQAGSSSSVGFRCVYVASLTVDRNPSAFSFTNSTNQPESTDVVSNIITPTGYDGVANVSVSGAGSPLISIDGGNFVSSGLIFPGQTLQVQQTTSAVGSTLVAATVTIGTTSSTWNATTAVDHCTATSGSLNLTTGGPGLYTFHVTASCANSLFTFTVKGAGGAFARIGTASGAAGGLTTYAIRLASASDLTVLIGSGGISSNNKMSIYGGGGKAADRAGGGGGRSEIVLNGVTTLAAAGGGGGGGGDSTGVSGDGGKGGGPSNNATNGAADNQGNGGGQKGTQAAGGAGGTACGSCSVGLVGSAGLGGQGKSNSLGGGGGGGGGYFGGGGGAGGLGSGGGGGGGSGYANTGATGYSTSSGSAGTGGAGGSSAGSDGADGTISFTWVP